MALRTRKPTGQPAWPLMLLAGVQKAGKTYAAAEASASDVVGRTLWIPFGEDDPDEYGALPGVRFEIVEHDGTFLGFRRVLREAVAEPPTGGPTLIVVDSLGRVWDFLQAQAQLEANERARRKGRDVSGEEIDITSDLWNLAKSRWQTIVNPLRDHNGPVLATARLEDIAVMGKGGAPTGERQWKVKAEKTLPGDVDVIVEMRSRSDVALTGLRSLKVDIGQGVNDRIPVEDFTVENVWRMLGLLDGAEIGRRRYTALDAERSTDESAREAAQVASQRQDRQASVQDLAGVRRAAWEAAQRLGWDTEAGFQDFEATRGKPLLEADVHELTKWIAELAQMKRGVAPRDPRDDATPAAPQVEERATVTATAGLASLLASKGVGAEDRLPVLTGIVGRYVGDPAGLSDAEVVDAIVKLRGMTGEQIAGDLDGFRELHAGMKNDPEANGSHNEGDEGNDGDNEGPDAGGGSSSDDGGAVGGVADAGAGQGAVEATVGSGEGGAGDGRPRNGAGRSKAGRASG